MISPGTVIPQYFRSFVSHSFEIGIRNLPDSAKEPGPVTLRARQSQCATAMPQLSGAKDDRED